MNLAELRRSVAEDSAPPEGLSGPLAGLWWQAQGEWDWAHSIVQAGSGSEAAWVHALLHREEGDLGNAGFWYNRAGRRMPDNTLDEEWARIATELLEQEGG